MWASSVRMSLVSFLNLFGVKVWILNLPKVQQVTIRGIFVESVCIGERSVPLVLFLNLLVTIREFL